MSSCTDIFVLDRSQLIPTSKIHIDSIISQTHFGGSIPLDELLMPEAIELRELGIKKGILILGAIPTSKEDIDLAIQYDISLTIHPF